MSMKVPGLSIEGLLTTFCWLSLHHAVSKPRLQLAFVLVPIQAWIPVDDIVKVHVVFTCEPTAVVDYVVVL